MSYDERTLPKDHTNPQYDQDENGLVDDSEKLDGKNANEIGTPGGTGWSKLDEKEFNSTNLSYNLPDGYDSYFIRVKAFSNDDSQRQGLSMTINNTNKGYYYYDNEGSYQSNIPSWPLTGVSSYSDPVVSSVILSEQTRNGDLEPHISMIHSSSRMEFFTGWNNELSNTNTLDSIQIDETDGNADKLILEVFGK